MDEIETNTTDTRIVGTQRGWTPEAVEMLTAIRTMQDEIERMNNAVTLGLMTDRQRQDRVHELARIHLGVIESDR